MSLAQIAPREYHDLMVELGALDAMVGAPMPAQPSQAPAERHALLLEGLPEQFDKPAWSDATVVVGDAGAERQNHIHRLVVALRCEPLAKMLQGWPLPAECRQISSYGNIVLTPHAHATS